MLTNNVLSLLLMRMITFQVWFFADSIVQSNLVAIPSISTNALPILELCLRISVITFTSGLLGISYYATYTTYLAKPERRYQGRTSLGDLYELEMIWIAVLLCI